MADKKWIQKATASIKKEVQKVNVHLLLNQVVQVEQKL